MTMEAGDVNSDNGKEGGDSLSVTTTTTTKEEKKSLEQQSVRLFPSFLSFIPSFIPSPSFFQALMMMLVERGTFLYLTVSCNASKLFPSNPIIIVILLQIQTVLSTLDNSLKLDDDHKTKLVFIHIPLLDM